MEAKRLYFDRPAANFLESVPIGNGRLGALVYGELLREQVVLNESSVWSGSAEESDRQDAYGYLPEIRRLLSEGKNFEAQRLFEAHFTCQGKGSNYGHGADAPYGCYQVLGRLMISYFQALSNGRAGCYGTTDYRRMLDLENGVASVDFHASGLDWKREWIASRTHQALYLHLSCKYKGKSVGGNIHFSLGMDRDERFCVEAVGEDTLLMSGQLDDGHSADGGDGEGACGDGGGGTRYACCVRVVAKGGTVRAEGLRLQVVGADEATVIVTARTDFSGFLGRERIDEQKAALSDAEMAAAVSYEEAKEEYIAWYQRQMGATELTLEGEEGKAKLPTSERIERQRAGETDAGLLALYVAYGKHLLIASSQKGDFPANLQGIWSEEIQTPWNGDWHLNAQQQLYWLAEKAGLSENHLPFIELTKELTEPGQKTAKAYYGADGWVVHTMTNPWKLTSPLEDAGWGSTVGSGAWQCHHLFEHYLYTKDRDYLKEIYPVLKGSAQFFADMLVEDKETGLLVTSPSSSPENSFLDEEGRCCALCEGPAYDRELVASLFEYCIEAQYVLRDDAGFVDFLKKIKERLAPVEIGADGRIMEWGRSYPEARPFHRHLSHLWGVYPGRMITPERTPELAAAAKKSLLLRGTTTPGWACAYRACVAARLRDGDAALSYVKDAFRYSTAPNMMNLAYHCDESVLHHDEPKIGIVPYEFQMDGNEANATALLLMLEDDEAFVQPDGTMDISLFLLPALPTELKSGRVKGIRAKGGLSVDLEWKDGRLTGAGICGEPGTEFTVTYAGETRNVRLDGSGSYRW